MRNGFVNNYENNYNLGFFRLTQHQSLVGHIHLRNVNRFICYIQIGERKIHKTRKRVESQMLKHDQVHETYV